MPEIWLLVVSVDCVFTIIFGCGQLPLWVVVCLVLGMWSGAARICCLARVKLWHIDCRGDYGGCRDLQLSPAVDRQGGVSARVG